MKHKFSIRKKTIALIILIAATLITVSMLVCSSVITTITDDMYRAQAMEIVNTVAQLIDVDRFVRVRDKVLTVYNAVPIEDRVDSEQYYERQEDFENYIAQFDGISEDGDFKEIVAFLQKIQNVNNVDCIYTICIDAENKVGIYIVDAAEEDACDPGTLDPIFEMNAATLADPEIGFPAYISDTEYYGWLVTAGAPIHDSDGKVVGYVLTDISMENVRNMQFGYVMRLLTYLIITVVIICVIGVIIINFAVIKPITLLTKTAQSYYNAKEENEENKECEDNSREAKGCRDKEVFGKLNIRTGDEIEELAQAMTKMESDINDHISNILSMVSELSVSKQHASEMTELAKKDSLTGLRNKTSYDDDVLALGQKIADGEAEFGIVIVDLNYLKRTNDTYGHEAGNSALKSLGKLICSIFVHSPVYRIGGDEFAVIVENSDYLKIEELVGDFKNAIKAISSDTSIDESERISAAIGYSVYTKGTDSAVSDVFVRADNEMYICKRHMKEGKDK